MDFGEQDLHFVPHPLAKLRIEAAQWLVQKKCARIPDQCPANGHALALPATESVRLFVQQRFNLEHFGGTADASIDFVFTALLQPQIEGEVFVTRHVRVECIGLKYHRNIAISCRNAVDPAIANKDVACCRRVESGDDSKQSRLATAGRTDDRHDFTIRNFEINVL